MPYSVTHEVFGANEKASQAVGIDPGLSLSECRGVNREPVSAGPRDLDRFFIDLNDPHGGRTRPGAATPARPVASAGDEAH